MQQLLGHGPGLELRATGEPPPERDYLLRRRLPTPRREQELLGEGPQVNRVWLAPGKGVARQRERGARREQRVGPRAGDSGARSVERPELLPTSGRLQELRRDAAESVLGPGEVVRAHRHDHGWLSRGRADGTADDLGVGDHVVAHRVLRQHPGHGAGARRPHRVLGLFVARRHVIGRHDDPREVVAELLVEYRGTLAVPGLAGLAVSVLALGDCLGRLVCLVARAHVSLEEFRHQQPDAGDPGEEEDSRDDVDDVARRECPVIDARARVGPLRRPGQLRCAEQEEHGCRHADDHDDNERIGESRRGRTSQRWAASGRLACGGSGSDLSSPDGRLDTGGDSTG